MNTPVETYDNNGNVVATRIDVTPDPPLNYQKLAAILAKARTIMQTGSGSFTTSELRDLAAAVVVRFIAANE